MGSCLRFRVEYKSSSFYDLHLSSVLSSSSGAHKRKRIYLERRSSRALPSANSNVQPETSDQTLLYEKMISVLLICSIDETTLTPTKSITGIVVPVKSLNPDGFQVKDITQRFGAPLSEIVVTFFTGSHDRSMRCWDRTEESYRRTVLPLGK
ncbi:Uncharacterized protein Rs2_16074 [Raphanus sativus]|nr:Uncharacterized protein Rs2_16074 [Raphanus sativus]